MIWKWVPGRWFGVRERTSAVSSHFVARNVQQSTTGRTELTTSFNVGDRYASWVRYRGAKPCRHLKTSRHSSNVTQPGTSYQRRSSWWISCQSESTVEFPCTSDHSRSGMHNPLRCSLSVQVLGFFLGHWRTVSCSNHCDWWRTLGAVWLYCDGQVNVAHVVVDAQQLEEALDADCCCMLLGVRRQAWLTRTLHGDVVHGHVDNLRHRPWYPAVHISLVFSTLTFAVIHSATAAMRCLMWLLTPGCNWQCTCNWLSSSTAGSDVMLWATSPACERDTRKWCHVTRKWCHVMSDFTCVWTWHQEVMSCYERLHLRVNVTTLTVEDRLLIKTSPIEKGWIVEKNIVEFSSRQCTVNGIRCLLSYE